MIHQFGKTKQFPHLTESAQKPLENQINYHLAYMFVCCAANDSLNEMSLLGKNKVKKPVACDIVICKFQCLCHMWVVNLSFRGAASIKMLALTNMQLNQTA